MPSNAMSIMIMILRLAAFDLFKTEKAYEKIFHFTKTESFSPIFEQAGYEGSNFINGTGILLGILIFYGIFLGIRKIMIVFIRAGDTHCDKKIVPWI